MWDEVHSKAIWALGEIGNEQVVPEIVPYIGNFNYPAIREASNKAMPKLDWGEFVEAFNGAILAMKKSLLVFRRKYWQEAIKALTKTL